MKNKLTFKIRKIIQRLHHDDGQAMVEYAIISSVMIVTFIFFNKVSHLIYKKALEMYTTILSLPFP